MRTTLIGLLPIVLLAGTCGGTSKEKSGEAAPTQSGRDGGSRVRDACALLTTDEVAAVWGSPVKTRGEVHEPIVSTCDYVDKAREEALVLTLEVYWQGGRDQWRIEGLATSGATRMMEHAEKDVDVGSILKNQSIQGLGDQAVFSQLMGGRVLKNDTMMTFRFPLLKKAAQHFRPLAEKALSRL